MEGLPLVYTENDPVTGKPTLTIQYVRRPQTEAIVYRPQFSSSLERGWEDAQDAEEIVEPIGEDGAWERVTIKDKSTSAARFGRVHVELVQ
jgi:hypothetical protein